MSNLQSFMHVHRVPVGVVGCIAALAIAGIYLVIVPEQSADAPLYAQLILRYGHSLCWILLGFALGLFAMNRSPKLVAAFAYAALISYGIFMLTFLVTKL